MGVRPLTVDIVIETVARFVIADLPLTRVYQISLSPS